MVGCENRPLSICVSSGSQASCQKLSCRGVERSIGVSTRCTVASDGPAGDWGPLGGGKRAFGLAPAGLRVAVGALGDAKASTRWPDAESAGAEGLTGRMVWSWKVLTSSRQPGMRTKLVAFSVVGCPQRPRR